MLVSISGSQGQGKSTTIELLKEMGVKVIDNKTSRSILADWGFTLNEVNKYPPLVKKFQEEILERHYRTNLEASNSNEWYVTERSFADIFTYCMFALGSYNEYTDWMDEYYIRCKEYQKIFNITCYLTGRIFTPEDDGVRSVNKHYNKSVDLLIYNYLNEFSTNKNPIVEIAVPGKTERAELIIEGIKKYAK